MLLWVWDSAGGGFRGFLLVSVSGWYNIAFVGFLRIWWWA